MTALVLVVPVVGWALAGLIAERRARRLDLPERAGAAAPLKGAVWAGRVLIWSTKSPESISALEERALEEGHDTDDHPMIVAPAPSPIPENEAEPVSMLDVQEDSDVTAAYAAPTDEELEGVPEKPSRRLFGRKPKKAERTVDPDPTPEPVDVDQSLEPMDVGPAPEPVVDAPAPEERVTSDLEPVHVDLRPKDEYVQLDTNVELEPFDALPKRPRIGRATTVCPVCRNRTKHDREGVCGTCHTPNAWLRRRWQIAEDGEEVTWGTTDVYARQLEEIHEREQAREDSFIDVVRPQDPTPVRETVYSEPDEREDGAPVPVVGSTCPVCEHRLYLDHYGRCVFCNTLLEVHS